MCLEDVKKVLGKRFKRVSKLLKFGGCLVFVWRMFEWFLEDVRKVSGGVLEFSLRVSLRQRWKKGWSTGALLPEGNITVMGLSTTNPSVHLPPLWVRKNASFSFFFEGSP